MHPSLYGNLYGISYPSMHPNLYHNMYPSMYPESSSDESMNQSREESTATSEDEVELPVYYTDGAVISNGSNNSRGACAYYLHDSCKKSWLDPTSPSTNQSAELGAIFGAVRCAYHKSEWRIKIGTDSRYAINCFTRWRKKWRKNGWVTCQNETVKNKHLILKILKTMKSVKVRLFW